MATTALIAEMIVIGLFSLLWMGLLLSRIFGLSPFQSALSDVDIKAWSTVIALSVLVVSYQVGWLVNGIAYCLSAVFLNRKRDAMFKRERLDYPIVRGIVYQEASSEMRGDLGVDRMVIRLSRAVALNFAILFAVQLTYGGLLARLAPLALAVAVIGGIQTYTRQRRYYRRMIIAFKVIRNWKCNPFLDPHGNGDAEKAEQGPPSDSGRAAAVGRNAGASEG